MDKLTKSQRKVFNWVKRYIKKNKLPPTRMEIARGVGYASDNAAQCQLKMLERKGYITVLKGRNRGIIINNQK